MKRIFVCTDPAQYGRPFSKIDINRWKENPVILWEHNWSGNFMIGMAEDIEQTENTFSIKPLFHEYTKASQDAKKLLERVPDVVFGMGGFIEDGIFKVLEISMIPMQNPKSVIIPGVDMSQVIPSCPDIIREDRSRPQNERS